MIYNSIFAKSFSRYEQKKLGYGAFVGFLLLVLSLCTVFKPYVGPIHDLKLKLSIGVNTKMLMINETSTSPIIAKVEEIETSKVGQLCVSEERTEYCQTKGDIRVHGKSSSVYIVTRETTKNKGGLVHKVSTMWGLGRIDIRSLTPASKVAKTTTLAENMSWSIRPYARKDDAIAMSSVRKWSVKPVKVNQHQQAPKCTQNHNIPAVVFSTAGYTGNHFHEFTDIVIPLFLTCRQFNGQVQLIITDNRPWWILKHQAFLKRLSNYGIMDIDRDDKVHCFPGVSVGLKRDLKELSIDPQKHSYSMKDFRDFLRSSYSLERVNATKIRDGIGQQREKPRLLILSRGRSRSFTNTAQIARMAKGLGFNVIAMEAGWSMSNFAGVVNSCDVLLGVHGAGLTNILFLPENAVFIQVVPYGGLQVEWLARNDFAKPSEGMNIKYLEYRIGLEESTLMQQYPPDHMVIKDPISFGKQGWEAFKSVYLDKQNVKLDVNRFRPTLQKALELLHQ